MRKFEVKILLWLFVGIIIGLTVLWFVTQLVPMKP